MHLSLMVCLTGCLKPGGRFGTGGGASLQSHIESVLPDTPAARQLANYLRAFNSGEVERMRNLSRSGYGKSAAEETSAVEFFRETISFYREAQALDIDLIESSDPVEIVARARSTLTGQWYRIVVKVAPEPPHPIVSFSKKIIPPPPDIVASRPPVSDQGMVAEISSLLDKLVAADMFSGVALIAKNGVPIFEKAYGFARLDPAIPNQVDTKFGLASVTKIFTGVAIAQLVEKGKLSYDDSISTHLPDYPNREVARKVTIHHLLTHTSGMGDIIGVRSNAMIDSLRSPRDYFPLFADEPPAFEPGKGVRYSNAGYIVLGAMVERVSGQSYADYLQEHIFTPAGMKNTEFHLEDENIANSASGFTYVILNSQDDLATRESRRPARGASAGGGYATAEDLLKFWIALHEHRLLNRQNTDLVMSGKVATRQGPDVKHAYGFEDEMVNGHRIVGHGGGGRAVNTQFDIYPDEGYTVIILSNYDPLAATVVANKLREILTSRPSSKSVAGSWLYIRAVS
jgi:CubicO group peptidase (beta-lactamase class C family)